MPVDRRTRSKDDDDNVAEDGYAPAFPITQRIVVAHAENPMHAMGQITEMIAQAPGQASRVEYGFIYGGIRHTIIAEVEE